ncbi:MAG: hypothetical protein A3D96_04010 [Chlamydiae bacterium RIFCSPHIGHO2_12_FULL_44_59]|nr:MAG: hypothetical protein A2796_02695 [Chlamydiae bacterium RIFCSPHIGHO2_01_FULL_44_39]OGN56815.1 MAG: hypothetical protein A3C42_02385 [Chlamydiae bacterium RIFCSPHIGHO2_02_FULL_45_9]OGN59922.1 MAG: hypothetical protein A3D96_04010 [Chlamydiae bacterium RIFCSPHIGHO2_12_FULL_44_59]OGN66129.1 MAG: hypothetical protein A2978_04525 [Chlamydiae bacterium RIFCSPLOWO2_01_FULL_44_52]OGN68664.1 MAG: hypothetical protein A3I67_02850 [Chlamydiae bacterium RIFCSPLOWO2_02_FULL_45_22]OGN69776.1 MAG: hyp
MIHTVPAVSCLGRLRFAFNKTFEQPSTRAIAASIAAAAFFSSSFRYGIQTVPVSILSFLGTSTFLCTLPAAKKFSSLPPLPPSLSAITKKIQRLTQQGFQFLRLNDQGIEIIGVPVMEELIFRGVIQTAANYAVGFPLGCALSAIAFSAVHYDPQQPMQWLFSLVGGLLMGTLRDKVSILAALGCHMGHNAFFSIFLGYGSQGGFIKHYFDSKQISPKKTY